MMKSIHVRPSVEPMLGKLQLLEAWSKNLYEADELPCCRCQFFFSKHLVPAKGQLLAVVAMQGMESQRNAHWER